MHQEHLKNNSSIEVAFRKQLIFYGLALGILACLFIGSYIFESSILKKQEHFAEIINLSARQTMLSQNIAARALEVQHEIETGVDTDHLKKDLKSLKESIEIFSLYQLSFLLHEPDPDSLSALNNEETAKLNQAALNSITTFVAESKRLIEKVERGDLHNKENIRSISELAGKIAHLGLGEVLSALDAISYARAKQAEITLANVRQLQKKIFFLFLLALILEALFLFIPEARRRRREAYALHNMFEQEKELHKFSALGEVSAKIVHEINNPLSAVIGRVDILLKNKDQAFDEKTLKTFESMKQNLWRIAKIIKLTKVIYRKGDNDAVTVFDLKNVIQDIVETTQLLKDKEKVKFVCNLEEGHFIKAQEHQVFQVINNIVGNAIDATSNLPEQIVYIELTTDSDSAIVRISDNGPGISPGLEEKIFEKLFTTKKTGTGIGLFESREIIESYGGSIALATDHSKSCFEIKIPLNI